MSASLIALLLAAPCATGVTTPGDDWEDVSAQVAVDRAAEIAALEAYAFTLTGKDEERKGIRTDGVAIFKGGKLLYEKYGRGWDRTKPHLGWSVTKTVTDTLVGVAVREQALTVDDKICDHLVLDAPEACATLTVRHLLGFASGLDWLEIYENKSNQESSVLAMLYGVGSSDVANFVARHQFRDPPGTSYAYSTGESALLAAVANAAMRKKGFDAEWPWSQLFDKVGMKSAVLERDARGSPLGGSHFYATVRDYGRYGHLWLHDGCWNGERVLPEDWVRHSLVVSPALKLKAPYRDEREVYGWQWTVNVPVPEVGLMTLPHPDQPQGSFAARGHWGQSVTVIPSLDLVVVRVGDDRERGFDYDAFVVLAMGVAR